MGDYSCCLIWLEPFLLGGWKDVGWRDMTLDTESTNSRLSMTLSTAGIHFSRYFLDGEEKTLRNTLWYLYILILIFPFMGIFIHDGNIFAMLSINQHHRIATALWALRSGHPPRTLDPNIVDRDFHVQSLAVRSVPARATFPENLAEWHHESLKGGGFISQVEAMRRFGWWAIVEKSAV